MRNLQQYQSHRKSIAGIPCDFISQQAYSHAITDALTDNTLTHIVTLNAEMVVMAQQDPAFTHAVQNAALIIPDGASILWAKQYIETRESLLRFFFSQEQPLTGVDSIHAVCEALTHAGGTAYLLGGTTTDRKKTAATLRAAYKNIHIHTLQDSELDFFLMHDTQDPSPKVLFAAYGAPKQTLWIEQHKKELEQRGIVVAIGIGGAFAMISGRLPRAPQWIRRIHMEWLWRLLLEPRRIKRIWNAVVVFPAIIRGYPH